MVIDSRLSQVADQLAKLPSSGGEKSSDSIKDDSQKEAIAKASFILDGKKN